MKFSTTLKSSLAVVASLALGFAVQPAVAATTTASTTFTVSATIQATCLVSATGMSFGTYTGVQSDTTSTVSVTCTNTTAYNVGLDAGVNGSGVTARQMKGTGGALLNYALYSDSTRATNWGNTVGTDTVTGTGNGSSQAITVYGRVAAGQYLAPGSYSDTVTATVTY